MSICKSTGRVEFLHIKKKLFVSCFPTAFRFFRFNSLNRFQRNSTIHYHSIPWKHHSITQLKSLISGLIIHNTLYHPDRFSNLTTLLDEMLNRYWTASCALWFHQNYFPQTPLTLSVEREATITRKSIELCKSERRDAEEWRVYKRAVFHLRVAGIL